MFVFIILLVVACNNVRNTNSANNLESIADTVVVSVFLPLEGGEVFLKDKEPFGRTIELVGKHVSGDTAVFNVREMQMLVKDDLLIVKNMLFTNYLFMLFDRSTLKLLKTFGRRGKGPDELMYPHLVPTEDSDLLTYAFEGTNQKLYAIDTSGKMQFYPFEISANHSKQLSDKQLININPTTFMYVETTANGKGIFRAELENDSIRVKEIYNLSLNPKRKSGFAYIGDFAANREKNRMMFAYKYFKIIKFMDLEAETVRILNFERNTFDETSPYKVNGLDANVTHYWGASAQPEYVYLLYSGRTPQEVTKENNKENYYIYVEQYDWNGNPIRKFKLDQWGYFTVDEKRKELILASTNDDDPFYVYSLP